MAGVASVMCSYSELNVIPFTPLLIHFPHRPGQRHLCMREQQDDE